MEEMRDIIPHCTALYWICPEAFQFQKCSTTSQNCCFPHRYGKVTLDEHQAVQAQLAAVQAQVAAQAARMAEMDDLQV